MVRLGSRRVFLLGEQVFLGYDCLDQSSSAMNMEGIHIPEESNPVHGHRWSRSGYIYIQYGPE